MRRSGAILLVAWASAFAWLGCNALLGIESAVLEPDGGASGTVDTGKANEDGPSVGDGAADASPDVIVHPCIDTFIDTFNCGTCGHDCLGGSCSAGRCGPVVIAIEPGEPRAIAVDATHVYWTNAKTGDVRRAPIAGGATQTLFDGPTGANLGEGLVRSGPDVYFTLGDVDGGVFRCPATGCGGAGPVPVIAPLDSPKYVGLADGGVLLFSENAFNGRVGRCTLPCASGPEFVAGPESFPTYVASANGEVYWSTLIPVQGNLRALGPASPATTLVTGSAVRQIDARGDEVFFAQSGSGVKAVPRDGGTVRRLSNDFTQTEHFVIDGTVAYFSDSATLGRILACDIAGCGDAGTIIASLQIHPSAVVVDKTSIYWTNTGDGVTGSIVRVAK